MDHWDYLITSTIEKEFVMTTSTIPVSTRSRVGPSVLQTIKTGLVAGGAALLANLALMVVGRLAGADFSVQPPNQVVMRVGVTLVCVTTLVPALMGTLLLVGFRQRGRSGWRALGVVGLLIGIFTAAAPFTVQAGPGTQIALAGMHVLTGLAWFLVLRHASGHLRIAP